MYTARRSTFCAPGNANTAGDAHATATIIMQTSPAGYRRMISPRRRRRRYRPAHSIVTMSAIDTKTTRAIRREAGTELPKISASNDDAGIPKSELRQSARMT